MILKGVFIIYVMGLHYKENLIYFCDNSDIRYDRNQKNLHGFVLESREVVC